MYALGTSCLLQKWNEDKHNYHRNKILSNKHKLILKEWEQTQPKGKT